jgi:hypothetical protein
MTKQEIISNLKTLDLSTRPLDQIQSLLNGLGQILFIVTKLPIGKVIMRARVNDKIEPFKEAKQLSYKPQECNIKYQRASTPNRTMFYGALIPDEIIETDLDNSRVIGFCEVSKLIRDKTITKGEQRVTFGKWIVTKEMLVITIIHHQDYRKKNSWADFLRNDYQTFIQCHTDSTIKDSQLITEYFASEFAKPIEENGEHNYLISAKISERLVQLKANGQEINGIIYPSVQTEGHGLNIAVTPETADTYLRLEAAVECTAYKENGHLYVDNDLQAILKDPYKDFQLQPITDSKLHLGHDIVYKVLRGEINPNKQN